MLLARAVPLRAVHLMGDGERALHNMHPLILCGVVPCVVHEDPQDRGCSHPCRCMRPTRNRANQPHRGAAWQAQESVDTLEASVSYSISVEMYSISVVWDCPCAMSDDVMLSTRQVG